MTIRFIALSVLYIAAIVCALVANFWHPALPIGVILLAIWARYAWKFVHEQDTPTEGPRMTITPTYQMYELIQRMSGGDLTATKELWPLVFDEPFDPTRPIEDILKDIGTEFEKYNRAQEEKRAAEEPKAEPTREEAVKAAIEATALAIEILTKGTKTKKR